MANQMAGLENTRPKFAAVGDNFTHAQPRLLCSLHGLTWKFAFEDTSPTESFVPVLFYPAPGKGTGYCFRSISFFDCFFVCFVVSNTTRKRLDRFA